MIKRNRALKALMLFLMLFQFQVNAQIMPLKVGTKKVITNKEVYVGAQQLLTLQKYILHKRVAVVANQTSMLNNVHLVDTLLKLKIDIRKVMSPEHGFRGKVGDGIQVNDTIDFQTQVKLVSLYGLHKKPDSIDLADVDVVLFDLQDVGVRFYTYISTLQYVMESCASYDKELIVLDRPNPNGFYIDGPVLKSEFSSFIGMSPIPVVHGLTVGEYAQMLNGECWLKDGLQCKLRVLKVNGYDHKMMYQLPVITSPNLPNMSAVYLYPSLCFFEGTLISVGRGTTMPFQLFGHPNMKSYDTLFTPISMPESAPNPLYQGVECKGFNVKDFGLNYMPSMRSINLFWLMESYYELGGSSDFFTSMFDKLAGTDELRKQILTGKTIEEIKASWKPDLDAYKEMRKKYLLYPDFTN